jgi:hypothetical protein
MSGAVGGRIFGSSFDEQDRRVRSWAAADFLRRMEEMVVGSVKGV